PRPGQARRHHHRLRAGARSDEPAGDHDRARRQPLGHERQLRREVHPARRLTLRSAEYLAVMSTSVVPRVSKGRVETLEAMFIKGGQAEHEDVIEREFEELFREHRRPAFRLAALLCGGDTALAEDTVSQAFADMLPRWRAGAVDEFGAYLR